MSVEMSGNAAVSSSSVHSPESSSSAASVLSRYESLVRRTTMCVQSSHTPSILARYEAWVRSNSTWVRSIEDTLRTVVLFMPGRFGDAEVQSQSIYTAVDLLSFYHDHILRRPRVTLQCGVDSAHTRTAKALITAVQYTEILIEMIATRRLTRDQRWLLIVLIEAVKTLSRLFLLIHNHGHVLVLGADEQPREAEIHTEAAAGRLPTDTPFRDILQLYASHGRGVLNPHGSFTHWTQPPPPSAPTNAALHVACGEALHIIRPTVYAFARYFCADSSWKPFLLSLAVDVLSRFSIGQLSALTRPQQEEIARRMLLWAFYLLRSPLFERFTKFPLSAVLGFLGKIPLIGIVFGNLFDLAVDLQQHHFYIAASST